MKEWGFGDQEELELITREMKLCGLEVTKSAENSLKRLIQYHYFPGLVIYAIGFIHLSRTARNFISSFTDYVYGRESSN